MCSAAGPTCFFSLAPRGTKLRGRRAPTAMSALFDFTAFLTCVLLTITTCTFVRMRAPGMLAERTG